MQITFEIPDALAGQLHLGTTSDLRSLLRALVEQQVSEGGLTVVQADALPKSVPIEAEISSQARETSTKGKRPQRDVMARLRGIYGDMPMSGEDAVLAARRMDRY